jgi:RNA polymerase sigma-70 factor (ECF subfamily)
LAADVVSVADGGGKATASPQPIAGVDKVIALQAALAAGFGKSPSRIVRYAYINGLPGFVTMEQGGLLQTTALLEDGKVVAIYVVRNPDKLRHLDPGSLH